MDLERKQSELKASYDAAKFHFISNELDLAITFCHVAVSSAENSRSDRNAQHAQKAYTSAIHFLEASKLTNAQRREIQEKVEQLDRSFKQLRQRPRAERKRASR